MKDAIRNSSMKIVRDLNSVQRQEDADFFKRCLKAGLSEAEAEKLLEATKL